jgi:hypothetical protein
MPVTLTMITSGSARGTFLNTSRGRLHARMATSSTVTAWSEMLLMCVVYRPTRSLASTGRCEMRGRSGTCPTAH